LVWISKNGQSKLLLSEVWEARILAPDENNEITLLRKVKSCAITT
jgi:hypothetical protein